MVKRAELIGAIEDVISKERRLAVVAERRREEDRRRLERQQRELTDKLKKLEDRKKPSRYLRLLEVEQEGNGPIDLW